MWGRGYTFAGGFRPYYPVPPSMFGGLPPVMPVQPIPAVNGFNPLMFSPFNTPYNPYASNATTYYMLNRNYSALTAPSTSGGYYGSSTGSMTGGVINPQYYNAQQDLARAQRAAASQASAANARSVIAGQWGYEQRAPAAGPAAVKPVPDDALAAAVAATDNSKLVSGEYLNRIAAAITAAEARGAKGASAQIGPPLLARVSFAGSPQADALTVLRRAGRLDFPAAFETVEALRPVRTALDKDIVGLAATAKQGKTVDSFTAATFAADVKKAQDALTPAIDNLPFDDAVAARRFVNQLDSAAQALKDSKAVGILNPQWETTGVSVADLVRFMAKNRMQFGPVSAADEEAYVTLHQALAGYLHALEQSAPQKK
jgi:hypothetical protein